MKFRFVRFLIAAAATLAIPSASLRKQSAAREIHGAPKPNIILILTDDQRWDTVEMDVDGRPVMPGVEEELIGKGVLFENAFVSTPLCCPDRASLLSGGFYPHHTGVLTNEAPNGGFERFPDRDALPVRLREAGYRTALIGKYLNQYALAGPYIPPGWSDFAGIGPSRSWFDYDLMVGHSAIDGPRTGSVEETFIYLTSDLTERAVHFIESSGDAPFFLYFAPVAPHEPATPAPGDEGLFTDYTYRGRSTDEQDFTDKPGWVRWMASNYDEYKTTLFARQQIQSLQGIDRSVRAIVNAVRRAHLLDRTVFIYTSDNGYLWGEHRLEGKAAPYEESIRVPLIVRMHGLEPRREPNPIVTNIDIGATINDLANLHRSSDGASLLPLLDNPALRWRTELLIQNHGGTRWSGIRSLEQGRLWKYIEQATGERELYDLTNDPFEEQSLHRSDDPAVSRVMSTLAEKLARMRGLNILTRSAPGAHIGEPYLLPLATWGGQPPLRWSVVQGQLPEGLVLDPSTGVISGTPIAPAMEHVLVRVEDSSVSPYDGRPQAFNQDLVLPVRQPGDNSQPGPTDLAAEMEGDQR